MVHKADSESTLNVDASRVLDCIDPPDSHLTTVLYILLALH